MAIKVHGNVFSTSTMRVMACLYEKELDFEFISVNMRAGEHKKKPYVSLNPFGQAPAFEDGDLKLFESRAINRYIANTYAEKGTQLTFNDHKKFANMSVWSEVEALRYDPPASKITWELGIKAVMGEAPNDANVEEQQVMLDKVLEVYEARLAQYKYLGGDCFTLVDLHHLPTLSYLMGTRVQTLFDSRPHVNAWCKEILARPAWNKVVAMKNKH